MKRLRVTIDKNHGNKAGWPVVTDADTGETFGVTSLKIEWDMESQQSVLTVSTFNFEMDAELDAWVKSTCPACQAEFWNPQAWEHTDGHPDCSCRPCLVKRAKLIEHDAANPDCHCLQCNREFRDKANQDRQKQSR